MKTTLTPLFLILLLITFSCSKEDDCDKPVDCLPPATQTGANTAGCLVDGNVLLPSGQSLNSGPLLHSQYLFHENSFLFSLGINDRKKNQLIYLRIDDIKLEEGAIYPLELKSETTGSAAYIIGGAGSGMGYNTTKNLNGELRITTLNESERIISGTFWFDAINNEGEIVKIREGRFDIIFQ